MPLTLSWRRPLLYISQFIDGANQWTGFYVITASTMKELNWSTAKCRRRKSSDTWYNIVICATLCVNFSSKSKATNVSPKHILKSNTLDRIIQARKKLFCHVIVKNYLCYVLRKISSSQAREGVKSNKKHPSWLHCTVVGLSEVVTGGFL